MSQKVLLTSKEVHIILHRLACQLIENHLDFSNTILIGLQPRGKFLAERIKQILESEYQVSNVQLGFLDITFFRDDFRRGNEQIVPSELKIDFTIQDKKIVLVDDVLYTGRSIRSALDALTDFGRPAKVELLVLVDRKYSRDLPIQPDYVGIKVDTRANDKVKVDWKENGKKDSVTIITNQK